MDNVVEIYRHGPMAKIEGKYPLKLVRELTSYPVQGAEFSQAYISGAWDGRKHLFNKRNHSFPTGLTEYLLTGLRDAGYEVNLFDYSEEPEPVRDTGELIGLKMEGKYSYQKECVDAMIAAKQGIIKVATGGGKTAIAAATIKYFGLPTLFVVSTKELIYQARKNFKELLGLTDEEVGIIGDDHWSPGTLITIALPQTLVSRRKEKYCKDFIASVDVLFADECHNAGSDTWHSIMMSCPAFYRFAMSGTPVDRTDGANLRLIGTTGEVVFEISYKQLVELMVLPKADIIWDTITEPQLPSRTAYPTVYKQGVSTNAQQHQKVLDWTKIFFDMGLSTLILVEEIAHGKRIEKDLWTEVDNRFIPHQFISGSETGDVRAKAIEEFSNREIPVMVASTILDEGVSIDAIDALILAGSKKSKIRTLQRLGRGLRGQRLIVVEFSNLCHKYLIEHSMARLSDYEAEECFPIHTSKPDADLVAKLWEIQGKRYGL